MTSPVKNTVHPLLFTLLLTVSASGLRAAGFEALSQIRSVNIGAGVSINANDDSGFSESASDGDGYLTAGPGVLDKAVGLSDFSLFTPYGSGGGSGRASQESWMNDGEIYFNGFADVFVSAGSSGDGYATASGSAASDFSFVFRLEAPTEVELHMSSGNYDGATSEYWFSLSNHNGTPIWDQTGIEVYPNYLTTFTVNLQLAPGDYSINAHVGAFSSYEGGFGFSGQAAAEFSLKVVPEPGAAALLLAGLAPLAGRRRGSLV